MTLYEEEDSYVNSRSLNNNNGSGIVLISLREVRVFCI